MDYFITIIVRVYNREDVIKRCFDNILSLSLLDKIHVLVIDDGSTDNSISIIKEIQCNHPELCIDIVYHNKNMGRGKALNTAKKHLKGKYCFVFDTDDIFINTNWLIYIYNKVQNNTYDAIWSGNINDMHWNHIYLSELFKIAPIPNFNYYEDHYTRWFFCSNKNRNLILHNIGYFVYYTNDSNDKKTGEHKTHKYDFWNYQLYALYEDVFYYRYEKYISYEELVNRFNNLNPETYNDVLMETYLELKHEIETNKYEYEKYSSIIG